ncbi:MAG: ArsC family reductase [Rhodospirillales bacterium]|nr:ArsC family reductase [Rhodospirillales bacterium]
MGMVTVYGIKNCDTIKKARDWLAANGVEYAFHDYKVSGIDQATLEGWVKRLGWEALLNRAGTTFKKLADERKAGLDAAKTLELMKEQPSMIKRPVLVQGNEVLVGFKPEAYAGFFAGK